MYVCLDVLIYIYIEMTIPYYNTLKIKQTPLSDK